MTDDYVRRPYPVKRGTVDAKGIIQAPPQEPRPEPVMERLGGVPEQVEKPTAPDDSEERVIRHELRAYVEPPPGAIWTFVPLQDVLVLPGAICTSPACPQTTFRGKVLYLEPAEGLYIHQIKVGNRSVESAYEGRIPVAAYHPAAPLDFGAHSVGNIICFRVQNDSSTPKLFAGAIIGLAPKSSF